MKLKINKYIKIFMIYKIILLGQCLNVKLLELMINLFKMW